MPSSVELTHVRNQGPIAYREVLQGQGFSQRRHAFSRMRQAWWIRFYEVVGGLGGVRLSAM